MNLVELVEANRRGRSNAQMTADAGDSIDDRDYFRRVSRIALFPTAPKIHGIARALEVSPATVIAAAAEQLGVNDFQPGGNDDPALLGAQARADRLQVELETERGEVRTLKHRVSRLQSELARQREKNKADAKERKQSARATVRNSPEARTAPAELDSEAMYWREHAMRYRQRLARYEGLRPLPRRHRP